MNRLVGFAFRNVWRSRIRSIALVGMIAVGATVVMLMAGSYTWFFADITKQFVAGNGHINFVVDPAKSQTPTMDWDRYQLVKRRLLSDSRVQRVQAVAKVSGILGNADVSAAASGIAVEDPAFMSANEDAPIPAKLGAALATTLGLIPGDQIGGLINDQGMTIVVTDLVETEAVTKDRFWIELPMAAIIGDQRLPNVSAIHVWLRQAPLPPTANGNPDLSNLNNFLKTTRSIPDLANWQAQSAGLGNTIIDKVVGVYRNNYGMVLIMVLITMFLAVLNILALVVHERGQEIGTLRAIGTPIWQIRLLLVLEAVALGAFAWLLSVVFSLGATWIINGLGGLVLPPPPTSNRPLVMAILLDHSQFIQFLALVLGTVTLAAVMVGARLDKTPITENLYARN